MRTPWLGWLVLTSIFLATVELDTSRRADAGPASPGLGENKIDGKTAKEWAGLLESKNVSERQDAARVLRDLGPEASFAVAALTKSLSDSDDSVRTLSAVALGKIGRPARTALPRLVESLHDRNAQVRLASLQSINSLSQRCSEGVVALGKALHHKDAEVRDEAIDTLGEMGPRAAPALPDLVKALREQESQVRVRVVRVIGRIGPRAVSAMPVLVAANKFETHREAIARAFGGIGPLAKEQGLRVLTDGLDSEAAGQRIAAALALWQVDRQGQRISTIVEELKNEKPEIRIQALSALAEIGPPAREAGRAILELLGDKLPRVREWATFALAAVHPDAVSVVGRFRELMDDKDENVTIAAIHALGGYGPAAKGAVEKLTALAAGKPGRLRDAAVKALAGIGPDAASAVPTLAKLADDGDSLALAALAQLGDDGVLALVGMLKKGGDSPLAALAQMAVVIKLEEIGPRAKRAVPALIEKLDDSLLHAMAALALAKVGKDAIQPLRDALEKHSKDSVQRGAALALGMMGAEAKPAVPDLVKVLDDRKSKARWVAADALGQIGRPALEAALPSLSKAMTDDDRALRLHAAEAYWKVTRKADAVLPTFREVLGDTKSLQRSRAAEALARLGAFAAPALPELTKALEADDADVKVQTLLAIAAIGPAAKEALPKVRPFANHDDLATRAAGILAAFRVDSSQVVSPLGLTDILRLGDRNARLVAIQAIKMLAPDAKADARILQSALLDVLIEGEQVPSTRSVGEALVAFGDDGIRSLAGLLASPDNEQRIETAEVLEKLGDRGRLAVPMLAWAAQDRQERVRNAALAALRKIDPDTASRFETKP